MKQFIGILIVTFSLAPAATAQDRQLMLRGITIIERPTSMPQLPADLSPRTTGADITVAPNSAQPPPDVQDSGVPNPGAGCPPKPAWCAYVTNPATYPECGCNK